MILYIYIYINKRWELEFGRDAVPDRQLTGWRNHGKGIKLKLPIEQRENKTPCWRSRRSLSASCGDAGERRRKKINFGESRMSELVHNPKHTHTRKNQRICAKVIIQGFPTFLKPRHVFYTCTGKKYWKARPSSTVPIGWTQTLPRHTQRFLTAHLRG